MTSQVRKIAGVDLGTTYSAIAHFDSSGKAAIIPNSDNERITPSVILFEEDEVIVGKIAKDCAVTSPERVIQFIKREIGDPDWVKEIHGHEYTPEMLSAIILKKLVTDAEEQVRETITDVVITVPAYFNDAERKATQDAGQIAGLNVLGVLNEPTAAALAYGLDNTDTHAKALVYDLGGGTFDVTVIDINGTNITVLATDGERRLGGKDWDDELLNYIADRFVEEHGIDPRDDLEANQDLRNKVEDAKKALSRKPKVKVFSQCQGQTLKIEISQEEFEEMTRPLLEQTETYLDVVLEKAHLTWDDIDHILLVGGSTRMPMVREMLERVSGHAVDMRVNPDEIVATGAVEYAAYLLQREVNELQERAAAGEEVEVPDLSATVPDEFLGLLDGMAVHNVNSHSLGVVALQADGTRKNVIMIPEQTPLPAEKTGVFGTFKNNQVTVEITVVEGESPDPEDCTEIGTLVISDLPTGRPKGSKIQVTYSYDESGRIEITAKDVETGNTAHTEIRRQSVYNEGEVAEKRGELVEMFDDYGSYADLDGSASDSAYLGGMDTEDGGEPLDDPYAYPEDEQVIEGVAPEAGWDEQVEEVRRDPAEQAASDLEFDF